MVWSIERFSERALLSTENWMCGTVKEMDVWNRYFLTFCDGFDDKLEES